MKKVLTRQMAEIAQLIVGGTHGLGCAFGG